MNRSRIALRQDVASMCFSASASFVLAATTAAIGIATLAQVRDLRQIPLAVAPLLFAVQQALEGAIWVLLAGAPESPAVAVLAGAFLIFALVLWPLATPLAVLLVEPDRQRRQILGVVAACGAALAAYLLVGLLGHPPTVVIHHNSLRYTSDVDVLSWSWLWRQLPYVLCTCAPLLLSSHRIIRSFGALVVVGFAVSAYAHFVTFTSVWCFFAAANSTLLYLHFKRVHSLAPATARARSGRSSRPG
jgi:Family of unknown function (DUF6629)